MASLLEQTRQLHQDIEQQTQRIVDDLLVEVKNNKERVVQETKVKTRLDAIINAADQILERYDDEMGVRKEELDGMTGDDVFTTFYDKLKDIKKYYRDHPSYQAPPEDYESKTKPKFSGAEVNGNFVDLQAFFERYINMPMFEKCANYMTYLGRFNNFKSVEYSKKFLPLNYKLYQAYLKDLSEYLISFQQRTNPLVDVTELIALIHDDFDKQWEAGTFPGWSLADMAQPKEDASQADNPLYCKACVKLFTKHSTYTNHLAGRKHKKNMENSGKEKTIDPRGKDLAKLEHIISSLTDLMKETISATQDYVLKKQTRTYEEMAADLEEQQAEEALSDSESEEEELIYNPLNLPLGWDGKPIPFWLYKLQGLNIEYKCDICGGFTYKGPRAYERHFNEWRHTYGLRCLGITNGNEYMHITKFEDAIALHEKLEKEKKSITWKEEQEEFEDDEGNVFNKKTYDDLKRQGII